VPFVFEVCEASEFSSDQRKLNQCLVDREDSNPNTAIYRCTFENYEIVQARGFGKCAEF
jgi:hypothetical protein